MEKVCPDCRAVVSLKSVPAGNRLLQHYECTNPACVTGPIYTVDVSSATMDADAGPVLRAMRELAGELESDAETVQEMMDALRRLAP